MRPVTRSLILSYPMSARTSAVTLRKETQGHLSKALRLTSTLI